MNYRTFGRMGWQVSEVGYGMWGMAGWTGSEDTESLESMQMAVDLGCNFFDTAWAYGDGHSEELLGKLLKNNPGKRLYTATKIPPKNRIWPSRRSFSLDNCYPPDHIIEYVESSLINTGVEHFDLVQFHTWEDRWLQDDRLLSTIKRLKEQGKFSAWGISTNRWEPWNGVQGVRSGAVDAVQYIYNIFDQNPEDELLPACQELEVAFIARVPFDEGSLTGNLTLDTRWPEGDWRNSYFVPENLKTSVERADRLRPLVPAGMTMAEMALRFILDNPTITTVIPGMRKLRHVESNLAVSDQPALAKDLYKKLKQHRWDRQPTPWSQ
jgi:aryl-alcohol dehydrogenase-like predicted oxidoreductase